MGSNHPGEFCRIGIWSDKRYIVPLLWLSHFCALLHIILQCFINIGLFYGYSNMVCHLCHIIWWDYWCLQPFGWGKLQIYCDKLYWTLVISPCLWDFFNPQENKFAMFDTELSHKTHPYMIFLSTDLTFFCGNDNIISYWLYYRFFLFLKPFASLR